MSFLVAAALAVGLLVVIPVLAHLLRRSRAEEREFPAAHLVPRAQPVARQRSRLEDRALLSIRALMVIALALLGATPLVRCSRLSIARDAGGSVALALLVDDSLSMQAKTSGGPTRFELAIDGARQLLGTAREGDAVAIILAGAPARLALAATTDLGAARRALSELSPTDRATDLESAVQLGRSALKQLPHVDRRVVLLSDLAGARWPEGEPPVWAPLSEVRKPMDDCAITSADSRGRRVSLTVACSSARAARDRSVELVVGGMPSEPAPTADAASKPPEAREGDVVGSVKLDPRAGEQLLAAEVPTTAIGLDVRLTGRDAIESDDVAPVTPQSGSAVVGVLADPTTSAVSTGGPTVIEQAIEALALDVTVRPLALVPDDEKELAALSILLLDDPGGLSPEPRAALGAWLERGGVAAVWLGPRAETVQLGTTLEPFVRGSVKWEVTRAKGIKPASVAWLGAPGSSLADLRPRGRARLEGVLPSNARILARWDDEQPWLAELTVGRGVALIAGLPASVELSDVALRPGFLALLDYAVEQALRRSGSRRTPAGTPWLFPASSKVKIEGIGGTLRTDESAGDDQRVAVPEHAGRYRVAIDGDVETRFVTIDGREVTTLPHEPAAQADPVLTGGVQSKVDISSEVALALLGLLLAELVLRSLGRFGLRRGRRRSDRRSRPSIA